MAKAVKPEIAWARLRAAQSLLDEADEAVTNYERASKTGLARSYRIEMKAYLDLWKRIQKMATNDVHKYGGAVSEPYHEPYHG